MRLSNTEGPIVVVVARAIALAAAFGLSVVIARLLGADSAGQFFLLFTLLTLVATVARWGTDVLILKLLSGGVDGGRAESRSLVLAGAVSSTVVAVVAVILLPPVLAATVTPAPPRSAIVLASLCVIPSGLYLIAAASLRGTGLVAQGTFVELGSVPVLTVLGVLALAASGLEVSVTSAFVVLLAASILTALVALPRALARTIPTEGPGRSPLSGVLARRWRQLTSMCGSATLFFALVWAPVIILGLVSTSAEVAYLTAASRIAAFILLIPAVQSSYLVPRFAALFHSGRIDDLNALSLRSTRQSLTLGSIVALVILLFPAQLLAMFGSSFEEAVMPLRVLAAGGLLVCGLGQVAPMMLTIGLEHRAAVLGVVALGAGGALMLMVGPATGSAGVAIVTAAANVGYAAVGAYLLAKGPRVRTAVLPFRTSEVAP